MEDSAIEVSWHVPCIISSILDQNAVESASHYSKFEAYDSKGVVISGDKTKELLVRDIWVFERSLFHPEAYRRLCARLTP